jgi:3'-phosphoadenosine 5'-phosphosulfate sulfotransferase (PAPS reductase)/FAD synthetase
MQSLSLEAKIRMTKERIRQWYEHWDGQVYVSFSGGKDSTVLKHIVDSMYDDVPSLFVNTGLEYPEIQKFVKDIKDGKFGCFNSDVEIVRPEMRFDEVVKKYGYPVVSKEVARRIQYAKKAIEEGREENYKDYLLLMGRYLTPDGKKSPYNCEKWGFLLNADFPISSNCCDVMKKKPAKQYGKQTGRKPIIGTMASESRLRYQKWIQHGCNAFDKGNPSSQPMSFWTEQDVLHYIKKFNVPYCSVYGEIVVDDRSEDALQGQVNLIDYLECHEESDRLKTTGCNRTGCIFCMFGCHLEKEPNRFQRLKETHPRQYEYCIGGGEMVDGKWQPNKKGLGLGKVLEYIGVDYE